MIRARAPLLSLALPLFLTLSLGLQGCAGWSPSQREPVMARAAPFDVLGRVLVSFDGRAFTANVRWLHAAQADDIWLMTPTGQALAYLREDGDGASFTGADQTTYRAARLESLSKRALGWELPVTHMQHWLRGEAAPGLPAEIVERAADGRARQMTQDGWRITYDYHPSDQNSGLPRRMELVGAAQTLRLVIDTWRDETTATP